MLVYKIHTVILNFLIAEGPMPTLLQGKRKVLFFCERYEFL